MTRKLNFDGNGTPFGKWLRKQRELDSKRVGLSIQNLDYIVHRYSFSTSHAIMLIEEKRYQGRQSMAQRDTHSLLDSVLRLADRKLIPDSRGRKKLFRYCGYHILTFECTTPDDGRMWWDGVEIDNDTLLKLLRFDINPNAIALKPDLDPDVEYGTA